MKSKVFNTTFENMLRILLLMSVLNYPENSEKITMLDIMCIYGEKCGVLNENLHGDNEFGLAEYTNKRKKISAALNLAVRNNYVNVECTETGFFYSLNDRGKTIVSDIDSLYSKKYIKYAKLVVNRFGEYTDEALLRFINKMTNQEEV